MGRMAWGKIGWSGFRECDDCFPFSFFLWDAAVLVGMK